MTFSAEALGAAGFVGFRSLAGLDTSTVTADGGVYLVLIEPTAQPRFLTTSVGGRFKQKDPTVELSVLKSKWLDDSPVVYIGKAASLRSRLRQYRDFGRGKPIGHWGGRFIWQLENHADLLVCWRPTVDNPRRAEEALLAAFKSQYGVLPFANLSH